MALMIVKETSNGGERQFELNHEHLRKIMELTGLDEKSIYTKLNTGQPLEDGDHRWVMVKQ